MANEYELEFEANQLIPRITDPNKLEEIAFVLELEIDEEIRGDARALNRHLLWYMNSAVFGNWPTRGALLARVVRMARNHLGIPDSVEQAQNGAGFEDGRGDDMNVGATGGAGLLIQVDEHFQVSNANSPPGFSPPPASSRTSPPRLFRYSQPNPQPFGSLAPTSYVSSRMLAPRSQATQSQNMRSQSDVRVRTQPTMSVAVGSSSNQRVPRPRCSQSFSHMNPMSSAGGAGGQPFVNPFGSFGTFGGLRASTPNNMLNPNPNNPFSPNNPVASLPQGGAQPLIPGLGAPAGFGGPPLSPPIGGGMGYGYPPGGFHRRELKLSGQIGNPGEAGKLSYSSLSFQIANARERHFDDATICAAVIRAITPNLPLRNYLERQRHLTLDMLIRRLRTHFLLKDATAAYNDMGNSVQQQGETELCFCMNVMGMRDDVLALSLEEGGQYTEELVQRQMQHVLAVGFIRPSVRHAMRQLLRTPNLTDDEILEALKEIVMNEAEHEAKVEGSNNGSSAGVTPATTTRSATSASVNEVSCVTDLLLDEVAKISQTMSRLSSLPSEVEKLKKELRNCQSNGVNNGGNGRGGGSGGGGSGPNSGNGNNGGNGGGGGGNSGGGGNNGGGANSGGGGPRNNNPRRRQVGQRVQFHCDRCDVTGPVGFWDHCFHCCGSGHVASDCPAKNEEE